MDHSSHGAMDHSGMDHGNHAAMNHSTPAAPAMNSTQGGGMGHGMGKSGCKISMLFNTNTINSCFLTDKWRITSAGMFAGSCIGVFLLGMALELLRRSVKEYDRFLVRQHLEKYQDVAARATPSAAEGESVTSKDAVVPAAACAAIPLFRPNLWQQAIRAFLHMLQFTVAYILMLLAMYYNVYMIVCIFLGAFFGAFIFQWEYLPLGGQQTSAAQEATVCCG